jgi:hypothetical protein
MVGGNALVTGQIPFTGDLLHFHYPLRDFYGRALANGHGFDWMPSLFGGFYVVGEGQLGGYHPLHWLLYRFVPLDTAFAIELVWAYPVLFAGMFVFLPALYGMSQWNLQSHGWDLIWPQMGRGIGLGLLFAPLSLAAMRYLHPKDVLQGAALYNLSRQTGGSLGIAVLATLLDHRADVHAAYLTEHVTSLSPATWQRLEMMRTGLAARGLDPAEALNGAYQLLHGVIEREANVLAFRDSYYFVILVIGALLPFVWIFRSKAFDLRNLGGGAAAASGSAPEASPDALAARAMAH